MIVQFLCIEKEEWETACECLRNVLLLLLLLLPVTIRFIHVFGSWQIEKGVVSTAP